MLSHLAQVQRQRERIVRDFSEESCPYYEFIVSQDASTFYALLHSNVLVLYHQRFFSHCYHFIHQSFIIRPRLIIIVVPLDVHNSGSFSRQLTGPVLSKILKGPTHFGMSLFGVPSIWMCRESNQTCVPALRSGSLLLIL